MELRLGQLLPEIWKVVSPVLAPENEQVRFQRSFPVKEKKSEIRIALGTMYGPPISGDAKTQ